MPTVNCEVILMNFESLSKICSSLGIKPADRILYVRISDATMQFYAQGKLVRSYAVSTSKKPPSNIKNSLGTPRGLHEIAERIGAGQPPGMVFISRVPTGRHFSEVKEMDEFYRIHESNLLHKKTGIRIKMSTSENYTGDEVTYNLYKVFILSKNNREVDIEDVDFKKSIFICNKREIKFENILK